MIVMNKIVMTKIWELIWRMIIKLYRKIDFVNVNKLFICYFIKKNKNICFTIIFKYNIKVKASRITFYFKF